MAVKHVDADHCIDFHNNLTNYNWLFELFVIVWAIQVFVDEPCRIVMLADDCSFVIAIAFVVDQDLISVQHVSMIIAHRPYHAMAFQVFANI